MYNAAVVAQGLGAYPGFKCYDAQRLSWWPYWINTPNEAQCVLDDLFGIYPGVNLRDQLPSPPRPPAVGVPVIGTNPTVTGGSNVTPEQAQAIQDKLIADEKAAYDAQLKAFMEQTAAGIDERTKPCSWYQTKDEDTGTCNFGSMTLWIVGIGAVAAAVYLKR